MIFIFQNLTFNQIFVCSKVNNKKMIAFSRTAASAESVTILTSLVTCSLISLLLNPIVFLFNWRKKDSVASLMFCVISFLDFINSVISPAIVFFFAATIDPQSKNMTCNDPSVFPLNCYKNPASNVDILLSLVHWILWNTIIITSGIMTVVRYIQIRYPFRLITRKRVAFSLIICLVLDTVKIAALFFSVAEKAVFAPAFYITFIRNPFELSFDSNRLVDALTMYIYNITLFTTESIAIVLSILTLLHLNKSNRISSNTRQKKGLCTIKIILINLTNFIVFVISLTTPVIVLLGENGTKDQQNVFSPMSQAQGWTIFACHCLTMLISSVSNPIIFIGLSPKCRSLICEFIEIFGDKTASNTRPEE